MTTLLDLLLSAILIGGGLFALVGSYGLLRLPRPMQRLHAPTKATTIGVGAALLVSALDLAGQGQVSWQEGLITLFLLLTAPVAALFLAKTLILRGEADPNLPDPGTGTPWATLAEERPDPRFLTIWSEISHPAPCHPALPHGIVARIRHASSGTRRGNP